MRRLGWLLICALSGAVPVKAGVSLSRYTCDVLEGTATGTPPAVYVYVDGVFYGATTATIARPELGPPLWWEYPTPAEFKDGQWHNYDLRDVWGNWGTGFVLNCAAQPHYNYYQSDGLTAINGSLWYQNGAPSATSWGLEATTANGGSLISKVGSATDEVRTTWRLTASGGNYVSYLRASPDALAGPAPSGSYYSVEVRTPTFTNGVCAATLAVTRRVGGSVSLLGSTAAPCRNGMTVRSIMRSQTLRCSSMT